MSAQQRRKAEQRAAFYRDGRQTTSLPSARASQRPATRKRSSR